MRRFLTLLAVLLCSLPTLAVPAPPNSPAGKKNSGENFVRVRRDQGGPVALELGIPRYQSKDGKTFVDLIGCVHVGEKSYYQTLNSEFKKYDAVLYELIADDDGKGRPIPVRGEGADNPLSSFQVGLKKMLGLSFQLDDIDYQAANLVHADISPVEFQASMKKRGESFQTIFTDLMTKGADGEGAIDEKELAKLDLMGIFLRGPSPLDRRIMRRILAHSFTDLDSMNAALNGPDGSTLVAVRNQKAIRVLREQLHQGKRRVAIFYGVAHMPDMEKRLTKELGLKLVSTRWLSAWDLKRLPAP